LRSEFPSRGLAPFFSDRDLQKPDFAYPSPPETAPPVPPVRAFTLFQSFLFFEQLDRDHPDKEGGLVLLVQSLFGVVSLPSFFLRTIEGRLSRGKRRVTPTEVDPLNLSEQSPFSPSLPFFLLRCPFFFCLMVETELLITRTFHPTPAFSLCLLKTLEYLYRARDPPSAKPPSGSFLSAAAGFLEPEQ